MLLPLLVGLAAQVATPAADVPADAPVAAAAEAPAMEPLAPEAGAPASPAAPEAVEDQPSRLVDVPDHKVTGTMGGLAGAASGCAAGMGLPALGLGAGGGFLYWLYGQAAIGACVGWTPALVALSTSGGMCGAAVCLPVAGAGAATAGAMYGAQKDGRDPLPALLGAIPGLGLGAIATGLGLFAVGVGVAGSLAAIQPVAVIVIIAAVLGLGAPPCAACGAGVADMVWGNPVKESPAEPLAGTGTQRDPKPAMRF